MPKICAVCETDKYIRSALKYNGMDIVRCKKCGLYFVDENSLPRNSPRFIRRICMIIIGNMTAGFMKSIGRKWIAGRMISCGIWPKNP